MLDFPKINQAALARFESLLHSWLPQGRRNGHEYKVGSLSGEPGDSLSINIRTGVWKDFASNEGGSDPVSLLAAIRNISQADAARELGGDETLNAPPPPPKRRSEWEPIIPAPDSAPRPGPATMRDFHYGAPEGVWEYHTTEGETVGFIRRFKKTTPREDGTFGKEIKPLVWAQNTTNGEFAWRPLSFPKPRPLYRLPELASSTGRVVIVEGEKCADALATMGVTVVTWPGGGQAIRHVDWTPLTGRKITIWPDADAPGIATAQTIAAILTGMQCEVRVITPPDTAPDGWDVADALADGWQQEQISELFRGAVIYSQDSEPAPSETPPPWGDAASEPEPETPAPKPRRGDDQPFRILGHDQGVFYYLSHTSRQIVKHSASGHRKENLLQLAPLGWWEQHYPGKSEGGACDWLAATNWLIQDAMLIVFDPADVRGRGAWLDEGRVIYHSGDMLQVDGKSTKLQSHESEFIYQRGRKIHLPDITPASDKSANDLLTLLGGFKFRNPLDHILVAGWLACAPICGALEWRPHLWISGKSGTGKTTLIQKVVERILGDAAVFAQGTATSEPGLRQTIQHDAFPIVIDEAESENRQAQEQLQKIIMLARQSSRESRARIIKGSTGGDAMSFTVRSMFMFASIGVAATQRADLSRITVCEMISLPEGEEKKRHWDDLQEFIACTAADSDWCAAIRARSIMLAQTIAKNAHTFARACARFVGAQRDGDQIGALLAGAWSLHSSIEITIEQATAWCERQQWETFQSSELDMDESRCFQHLMGAIIQHEEHGHNMRRSVAELVKQACTPGDFNREAARNTLERHGIKLVKDGCGIDIADSHQELRRIFIDTGFSGKWKDQFKRLTGAKCVSSTRFNGVPLRCVRLPMNLFDVDRDLI